MPSCPHGQLPYILLSAQDPFTSLSGSRFVARSVVNISLNAPNQEHFLLVLTAPRAPLLCMNPCALHALLQPGLEVPGT